MKQKLQDWWDDFPQLFKIIICFFIGHKRTVGDWDLDLCTRCYEFIPKKKNIDTKPDYHGRGLAIASFLIRMSAFWLLSGLLALIIIGFMTDFELW
jgi:hypothetical protein